MWITAIASLFGSAVATQPIQGTAIQAPSTSPIVYIAAAAGLIGVGALIYLAVKD